MFLPAPPPQPIPLCVVAIAIAAASTDLAARRIPNVLIMLGLTGSLVVHLWLEGLLQGPGNWLAGIATGFALLLPVYWKRGTSAGDVKLLMAIGSWVGAAMTLEITLVAFLIGGLWSVVFIVHGRHTARAIANLRQMTPGFARASKSSPGARPEMQHVSVGSMPYGVAIAAGTVGVLLAAAA